MKATKAKPKRTRQGGKPAFTATQFEHLKRTMLAAKEAERRADDEAGHKTTNHATGGVWGVES